MDAEDQRKDSMDIEKTQVHVTQNLKEVLEKLAVIYTKMQLSMEQPIYINDPNYPRFRYETQTDSLACFLKGVKAISTINAALILLREGYAQEVGALCRMIDDFCNEILFMLIKEGEDPTNDQIRFIKDFFQEELDKPGDAFGSAQKRDNVSVKRIQAGFGRLASNEVNPSDAQELLRTTHQVLSGYVHGAYPHIMEMFGGIPPCFHMTGMLGARRITEWQNQLVNYVYRILMASVFISMKLEAPELGAEIVGLLEGFEESMGCAPAEKASTMLRKLKTTKHAKTVER